MQHQPWPDPPPPLDDEDWFVPLRYADEEEDDQYVEVCCLAVDPGGRQVLGRQMVSRKLINAAPGALWVWAVGFVRNVLRNLIMNDEQNKNIVVCESPFAREEWWATCDDAGVSTITLCAETANGDVTHAIINLHPQVWEKFGTEALDRVGRMAAVRLRDIAAAQFSDYSVRV